MLRRVNGIVPKPVAQIHFAKKQTRMFRIVFNNELHTATTKTTYTIEEDNRMIYQMQHIYALGVRSKISRPQSLSHIMKHPVHIFILLQSANEFTYIFRFSIRHGYGGRVSTQFGTDGRKTDLPTLFEVAKICKSTA